VQNLQRIKHERDNARVNKLLEQLKTIARDESANIMPITIELVFGLG
jgi:methylmalonyl-CoA mutase N-terminal domain/subunit